MHVLSFYGPCTGPIYAYVRAFGKEYRSGSLPCFSLNALAATQCVLGVPDSMVRGCVSFIGA
jgi:hypothetical protein